MTDIDAIDSQVIAALAASVLYMAAYMSFVHLLRFPRNWSSPGMTASLVTGGLVALTVTFVSMSPGGIDGPAFAVTIGFIAVIFYIIAAPAIAFRPASQPVEYLAKHGDYAGLWLLGPALLASLAIPNIKLQAVLATAIVIEFIWFLRQRWLGRRRQIFPLNDIDLSVLRTQAKGNLAAFKKRHGIRELLLSKHSISWRGCGKLSSPCPFNLYVNRLGLNTAPCCRGHMKVLSRYVVDCLSEMGFVHWLEGGSLLGAVRENGALLDWEDDIDISVLLDDQMTWRRLADGLVERGARDGFFVDVFERNGFVSISFDQPIKWPFRWERNRLRGEIRTDVAIYRRATSHGEAVLERQSHKAAMPVTESGRYGIPEQIILPTSKISFLGGDFSCPNQSESYLRVLYGDFEKTEYTYVDAGPAKARSGVDATGDHTVH